MGGWSWDDGEPDERSTREAENAVRQARRLTELLADAIANRAAFMMTPVLVCELNDLAVAGLVDNPGRLRIRDVEITGSRHEPPTWPDLPALLDEMCEYINASTGTAIHLAAYSLWRLNWIHPFEGGNGRTSRAVSYLLLCAGIGRELPGETTLVERLVGSKIRYYRALEAADRAWAEGQVDVSQMEQLLEELLRAQLGGT